jgi:hypothetical protein
VQQCKRNWKKMSPERTPTQIIIADIISEIEEFTKVWKSKKLLRHRQS